MIQPSALPVQDEPHPVTTRRALGVAALVATALTAAPSQAAEPKKDEPVSNHVDLPSLVLPVAQDGRLLNYLFVQTRVHFADGRSAEQIRTHQFFARDAIVRATGRTHVPPGAGARTYDATAVQRLIATAVAGCMPNTRVARVEIRAAEFMR